VESCSLVQDLLRHLVVGVVLYRQSAMAKEPREAFQEAHPTPRSLGSCLRQVSSLRALTTRRVWQICLPSSPNLSSFRHQACHLPPPRPSPCQGFLVPWYLVLGLQVECFRLPQHRRATEVDRRRRSQPWHNSHHTALPHHRLDLPHLGHLCSLVSQHTLLSRCVLAI
jgi:hypothetical protein